MSRNDKRAHSAAKGTLPFRKVLERMTDEDTIAFSSSSCTVQLTPMIEKLQALT